MHPVKMDTALVVEAARSWIGTPYLHQAASKNVGCDCLGLIRGVWRELGGEVPPVTIDYASTWSEIDHADTLIETLRSHLLEASNSDAETAQIVAFRLRRNIAAKHVAILTGEGTFIHAYDGNFVVENALSHFWQSRIAARFFIPALKAR